MDSNTNEYIIGLPDINISNSIIGYTNKNYNMTPYRIFIPELNRRATGAADLNYYFDFQIIESLLQEK